MTGAAWNWIAGILFVAMAVVAGTLLRIVVMESKRHALRRTNMNRVNPELILFAATGLIVVVLLWSIMVVQWFRL